MELKEWRTKAGLTQAELAERLQVTRPYITAIENKTRQPSFVVARSIHELTEGLVSWRSLSIDGYYDR